MPYLKSTQEQQIPADAQAPKVIKNLGPNTLYYKATTGVSTADTAVSSGSEVEINATRYIISAAGDTRYEVVDVPAGELETTTAGPPSSGPNGTGAGSIGKGGLLTDTDNGVTFFNEGTLASPYWTPVSFNAPALFGVYTDFRDQAGVALAGTGTETIVPGSGLRIFGQGIAETDSGLVVQTAGEGGSVGRLSTTNEAAHTAAIGMEAVVMQPDQHKLLVVDVELSHVSAITNRATFIGFVGAAADALDPVTVGGTTTATHALDDLAGIFQDTGFTDADGLMLVSEKANTSGTQVDLTAAGTLAAAGTFQRFRVEVDATGEANAFLDKAHIGTIPGATGAGTHSASATALDADEEVSPVVYVEANTTSVTSMDVKRFATWAYR